jgi:Flp pilus assembly pilin Flp
MPLFDVVGNAASVAPEQIGATAVNVGVICVLITISIVAILAQGSVGVNV